MIVYVGGRYTATVQATVTKQVPCEKCGTLYGCRVTRRASGTGRSPYYTDNQGAQQRARQYAEANLRSAIANTVDIIPCPKCGWFQANMVGVLWKRKHGWMFPVGLTTAIAGGFALLLAVIANDRNPAAVAITAAIFLSGVALLFVKPMLRSKFDPNADCAARAGQAVPGVFVIPNAQLAPSSSPGRPLARSLPAAPAPEQAVWYHLKNDQQLGPMTESAMRERAGRGELQPTDFVWKAGMSDWAEASTVKEFFTAGRPTPARAVAPPPLPPMLPPFFPQAPAPMPAASSSRSSRGMPVWGWALIGVAAVLIVGMGVVFVRRASAESHRTRCAYNMHQIGVALFAYANSHSGIYPASPADLLVNSTLTPSNFICPSGDDTPASGATPQQQAANLAGTHLSYVYVANRQVARTSMASTVLLYEKADAHSNEGRNFLFGDGRVEFVPLPRAQQLIQQAQVAAPVVAVRPSKIAVANSSTSPPPPSQVGPTIRATTRPHISGPATPLVKGIQTAIVGGNGGAPYTSTSFKGENVVGFRYEMSTWDGHSIVHILEPLYPSTVNKSTLRSRRLQTLLARNGYIVGGLMVDGKDYANAIRILFVRWDGQKTDPADTYLSDWLGTPIDDQPTQLAGHGERVIGICGRRGLNFDALGLVVQP